MKNFASSGRGMMICPAVSSLASSWFRRCLVFETLQAVAVFPLALEQGESLFTFYVVQQIDDVDLCVGEAFTAAYVIRIAGLA